MPTQKQLRKKALEKPAVVVVPTKGGEPVIHHIYEGFNRDGYLVAPHPTKKNFFRFYYNSSLFPSLDVSPKSVSEFTNSASDKEILEHPTFSKLLLRFGENPNGYHVYTGEEWASKKEADLEATYAAGKVIEFYTGYGDIRLRSEVPKSIWEVMKPAATYVRGNNNDMEWYDDQFPGVAPRDVRGWIFEAKVWKLLKAAGYTYSYNGNLPK